MVNWNQKSKDAWDAAWSSGGKNPETGEQMPNNLGSTIAGLAGGITSIVDAGMKNAQIADTSGIHSSIDDTANTEFAYNDYDSLLSGYNPYALQPSNYSRKDIRGVTGGEMAMNTISGALSGAAAGAQVGGPWGAVAGAAVGLGSGLAGIFTGNAKAKREANLLNAEAENANKQYMQNFAVNASTIGQGMFNSAALNLAAEGGQLDIYDQSKVNAKNFKMKHKKSRYKGFGNYYAYGGQMMSGDWSNGVVTINEGDTHERNPLGGVLMGVDPQGVPNLVEEGEVIFNDYVYSNRLKTTAKQLEEMHLDPKLEGLSFAEAAKKVSEESELRPMDSISKNTLVDGLAKLTVMQEETRMKKERAKMLRMLRHMATQEPQEPQEMQGEVPVEGDPMAMESQGTQMPEAQFSERTPRAYKQIQEEMPEQYAHGGMLANYFDTGSKLPLISNNIADFEYWDAANNDYNREYKDWINTYDLTTTAKWAELSKLYKDTFGTDLDLATARRLALDKKYGNFHTMAGDMYKTHLASLQPADGTEGVTDPIIKYILRGADANGLPIESEITDYDPNSGKYKFLNTSVKDGVTTHYFSAKPETPEPEVKEDDGTAVVPTGDYPKTNFLQYAPAIGGALSTLASLFQKPDYTNADRVAASRRNVRRVSNRPISGFLGYNPYDTNLQQTKLANQTAGTMRNILNTSSGNRAAAMTDLLAYNAKGTEQSGDIYRQALEFNDAQRLKVGAHNTEINKFNSQQGLQADAANQSTDLKLLDNVFQEAKMRDSEFAGLQTARSANLTNLFNNMGEIGKDIYTAAQEKYLIDRGYVPGVGNVTAKGGSIRRRKRKRC